MHALPIGASVLAWGDVQITPEGAAWGSGAILGRATATGSAALTPRHGALGADALDGDEVVERVDLGVERVEIAFADGAVLA